MTHLSISTTGMEAAIRKLRRIDPSVRNAIRRAVNKTAVSGRAVAVEEVGRVLNLKAKDIRERIDIRKAGMGESEALLLPSRKNSGRVPLDRFSPRPGPSARRRPKGGVSVQVKKTGPRKVVQGAFWGRMRGSGTRTLFVRTGAFGRNNNAKLEKIKRLLSNATPWAFLKEGRRARRAAEKKIRARLRTVLLQELRFELRKKGGTA